MTGQVNPEGLSRREYSCARMAALGGRCRDGETGPKLYSGVWREEAGNRLAIWKRFWQCTSLATDAKQLDNHHILS